jgi:hypothetical protein
MQELLATHPSVPASVRAAVAEFADAGVVAKAASPVAQLFPEDSGAKPSTPRRRKRKD